MPPNQDKEIQQYRDLMQPPDVFEDTFGPKMIVATLFLGFLMVPGSIYLSLFMGAGLGPAAQWVTVILFAEVAKRSMKSLKTQEVYLLFYMTGLAVSGELHGGMLTQLLFNQYLVQSPAAEGMGIASEIPAWVAPSAEIIRENSRTFISMAWRGPVLFLMGMMILSRLDTFGLGYALYRITAHVEKLPFPMAPVHGMGITAISDDRDPRNRWRWRAFSIGGMLGLGFGLIYIGVPAITGALFNNPVKIIPIPWLDLTPAISTPGFMPATPMNLVFDAGLIILGMVLPFWAVVGGFIGLIITLIANPILYRNGVLTSWQPGMKVVDTVFYNNLDFYLSFSIGLMLAIFGVSLLPVFKPIYRAITGKHSKNTQADAADGSMRPRDALRLLFSRDKRRGDMSILWALLIYVGCTLAYVMISLWLMPGTPEMGYRDRFPWMFFLAFGLLYQPIIGYTNAKLEGMVGQTIQIPLVREAAFILSGYKGAAIWFAPVPISDYPGAVRNFRVMELTGTRLWSIVKVELIALPILMFSSLLFSEMIWRLAPIPSDVYPFTQEVWHQLALNKSLQVTATAEGSSLFLEAVKFDIISWGLLIGLGLFGLLNFLNMPTFLVFGAVRGLGQTTPGHVLPEMVGALVARFYLERKLGRQNFKRQIVIIMAGFSAGVGLTAMMSVALVFIAKSTTTLGY